MTVVAIREAGPYDLEIMAELHAACFDAPWSVESFAKLLALPGAFGLIACQGEDAAPIGFALCQNATSEAELLTLGVAPAWRHAGGGRALLQAVIDTLAARGATSLVLEVADDNHAARALYLGFGFQAAGRRPMYYGESGGRRRDALLLRRPIGAG